MRTQWILACLLLLLLLVHPAVPETATEWRRKARDELTRALGLAPNTGLAHNVILFLGDGMGVSTVTAARIYRGQLQGHSGEETHLAFEDFPHLALSKTYNDDAQIADSAGTATAFLCGVKANFGTVGVDSRVSQGDCQASQTPGVNVTSIADWARDAGKSVGVVTTTRITHATPAALYAKSADRDWESDANSPPSPCTDIALQLASRSDIQVVIGGGRRAFLPVSSGGNRQDGRNLTQMWLGHHPEKNSSYVETKAAFDAIDPAKTDRLLGLLASSHLDYDIDRNASQQPSLADMTSKAIRILQKNPRGFFLLVEGGRIDHGHHDSNAKRALHDVLAFEDAVKAASGLTSEEDTLTVVTADHSHVFNIAGYPRRGNPLFGLVEPTRWGTTDNMPWTTLVYGNGPGDKRENLTGVDTAAVGYVQAGAVPMDQETHGGEDVPIFARGPMGHLFHGVHEQHYISHVMAYAACLGEYRENCRPQFPPTPAPTCSAPPLASAGVLAVLHVLLSRWLLV